MKRQRILKILKYLKISLLVPFILLLFVHFVIKDRSSDLTMIFYMTPVPVLIGIGLILSLILIHHKKWFWSTLTLTLLLIIHWFIGYYGFKEVPVSASNNHILFWNIDDSKFLPREVLHDKISTYDPDIIAFLETRKLSLTDIKFLKEQFPQYSFNLLQGYALFASKDQIEMVEYQKIDNITRYNLVKVKIDDELRTILLVDIGVTPKFDRWQDLDGILDYSLGNKVDLVVGDFNTPLESVHFDGFKDHYTSFHHVSEGFAATWPKGLPLLELDQIWVTPVIKPISLKKFYLKGYSNHDMLIGSFKLQD